MILKFRAWVKSRKKMYEVTGFAFGDEVGDVEMLNDEVDDYMCYNSKKGEVEVMQYVWLEDDKKKEIYTEDIVRTEFGNSAQTVVEYRLISLDDLVYLSHLKYLLSKDRQTRQLIEKVEIVGNKFENPELLKKLTRRNQ